VPAVKVRPPSEEYGIRPPPAVLDPKSTQFPLESEDTRFPETKAPEQMKNFVPVDPCRLAVGTTAGITA